MNGLERYFHGPFVAARAYLLGKVFLCMVALDTWMLMIGHAGRYGVDGFNVAHFRWLDRLMPVPSAALYVGVLVLTGLCALSIALGAGHRLTYAALFLLYTFSWSMSMLDSYQHHYFVSLVLLCTVFFPNLSASDVHAQPALAPAANPAGKKKKDAKKSREAELAAARERNGFIYFAVCAVALLAYAKITVEAHPWLWFLSCVGTVALATFVYRRGTSGQAPVMTGSDREQRARDWGFGFNLLGVTTFILYTYTSIAKMDAQWCEGNTIQRISTAATVFGPLADWLVALGLPREKFWSFFATSVIPVELSVACGYLLAVARDRSANRWLDRACVLAFVLAMTLHVGAEAMKLEIGWFSYYMMLLACTYLLPGVAVDRLATLVTWPARLLQRQLDFGSEDAAGITLALAAGIAGALGVIGHMIDLPGAQNACLLAAAVLVAVALAAFVRKQSRAALPAMIGTGAAAVLMLLAIASSEVRWDFYRYLGGDLRRRNQPEAALEAYERGERYAPKGESRRDKIQELKQLLGK